MRKHTRGVVAIAAAGAAALAPAIAGPSDAVAASAAATTAAAVVPLNGPTPVRATTLFRTTSKVRLSANRTRTISVRGHARVPGSRVDAVQLRVSVRALASTRVTLWPTGARKPGAQVSVPAHRTVTKTIIVRLGSAGRINLASSSFGPAVTLTVVGYVATPNLGFVRTDPYVAANRLVFNTIKYNVGGKQCGGHLFSCTHTTSTVRVRNNGRTTTTATASITAGRPFSVSPRSIRLAPGASANLTVTFSGTASNKNAQAQSATLALTTSDHKWLPVALVGLEQKTKGEPFEPSVGQILNSALHYGVRLGTLNQFSRVYRTHPGSSEVNAPYFRAVGSTVTVRQVAKWTNSVIGGNVIGVPKTIQWAAKQSHRPATGTRTPATHTIATDSADSNQTILPTLNGRAITGSFRPGTGAFQLLVAGDYSDDVANVAWHSRTARWAFCGGVKASQKTACPAGHVIKVFPLPGHANTYVVLHDDSGVNLDYNDEIWIVSGVKPVASGWAGYVK